MPVAEHTPEAPERRPQTSGSSAPGYYRCTGDSTARMVRITLIYIYINLPRRPAFDCTSDRGLPRLSFSSFPLALTFPSSISFNHPSAYDDVHLHAHNITRQSRFAVGYACRGSDPFLPRSLSEERKLLQPLSALWMSMNETHSSSAMSGALLLHEANGRAAANCSVHAISTMRSSSSTPRCCGSHTNGFGSPSTVVVCKWSGSTRQRRRHGRRKYQP